MFQHLRNIAIPAALGLCLAIAGCVSNPTAPPQAGHQASFEGTVLSIDTQPWAYDGNAVVYVQTPDRRRVAVQLPARWNLCKAPPVDVQALAVGMRVRVVGTPGDGDEWVVCQDAAHRLVPVVDG